MLIKEIQTGKTISGKRKAILIADEKVKAGDLAGLTTFLKSKEIIATPGYDEGHLLRVSNFKNDEELRTLLLKEFPDWAKGRNDCPQTEKLMDEHAVFIPLDRSDKSQFSFKRFSHQYSTPLVGAMSSVSAAAMLGKDVLTFRDIKTPPITKIKAGISGAAASFFITASLVLTGFGIKAAHKPSVSELIKSLEPQLNLDPNASPSMKPPTAADRIYSYVINSPWKMATFLNFCGVVIKSVGHSIPDHQVSRNPITLKTSERYGNDRLELTSTLSSLAGLGLIASASSKKSSNLLDIESFDKSKSASDPLEKRYHISHSIFSPLDPANDQGKGGHLNMKAAGLLSMASNTGFGAKGVLDVVAGHRMNDEVAMRARNSWPLLLILPFNIAADYFTTLSKPHFSYSLDELATDSADYIAHKLDMKKATPETVTHQAYILSELLARHPRVTKSAHQLREAIAARLEMDYGYQMPAQGTGLKEYQHLQEISPFSTKVPKKEVPEKPASAVSAIERMQPATIVPLVKERL